MTGPVIFGTVMYYVWGLLSWRVPGFNWTAGELVLALIIINFAIAAGAITVGVGQRSSHSGSHRISKERKNDER